MINYIFRDAKDFDGERIAHLFSNDLFLDGQYLFAKNGDDEITYHFNHESCSFISSFKCFFKELESGDLNVLVYVYTKGGIAIEQSELFSEREI